MKKFWQQFTSQERRVIAVVGLVLFILINLWFVRPHFHDFARAQERMEKAESTLAFFQKELAKKPVYEMGIKKLTADASDVPPEEQAFKFVNTYTERANQAGVIITGSGRSVIRTNDFFLEQEVGINVQAMEKQLVDFLYNLGSGNSLMRVKTMNLRPDQSHQNLVATLAIVASYQKKAPAKSGIPAKSGAVAPADKDTPKPANPAPAKLPEPKPAVHTNKPAMLPAKDTGLTNQGSALGARPAGTNKPASSPFKRP